MRLRVVRCRPITPAQRMRDDLVVLEKTLRLWSRSATQYSAPKGTAYEKSANAIQRILKNYPIEKLDAGEL